MGKKQMYDPTQIAQSVRAEMDRISILLGDAWSAFQDRLLEILKHLEEADEEMAQLWVDELLDLGLNSPAAEVFREILRQSQSSVKVWGYDLSSPPSDAYDMINILQTDFAASGGDIIRLDESSTKGLPSPRYLNAGFFVTDAPLSTDQPLTLQDSPYRLGVNVGKFWGPGHPDKPFPERLLQPYFEDQSTLKLDVAVRSLDVEVTPAHTILYLQRDGDSPLVFFDLRFTHTGRQAIDVDLLFRGHLLQSRRVEVEVVTHAGVELPESAWPVQDGYVTFTRTAMLACHESTLAVEPHTLSALMENPRTLTIVAERDLDYNRIGLHFYDATGTDWGFQQSTLTDANLTRMLAAARGQLSKTMHAYAGAVRGTETVLTKHLGQLAAAGRRFYLALLPGLASQDTLIDEGQRLNIDLEPGTVIQVAPLSSQLSVPWELFYERKIEAYREGRITLCPTFLEHGPAHEDCPAYGDPTVVCPHGFWGYRYIIEQLPCRVEPHEPLRHTTLPLWIHNGIPSRLNANVSTRLRQLEPHLRMLRALAPETQLKLVRIENLDHVKAALVDTSEPADIVYFYAHGGSDCFGSPYLEVGAGDQIQLIDLDAWGVKLYDHHPLVVLNACESADYAPDSFENMVKFFCDAGAAGVVGTQCEVKEKLAHTFIAYFFQSFFGQATAGQALFEARQKLLRDHLDPRGLTYSLFAAADAKLAQPIIA